jgi:hypothetical protein
MRCQHSPALGGGRDHLPRFAYQRVLAALTGHSIDKLGFSAHGAARQAAAPPAAAQGQAEVLSRLGEAVLGVAGIACADPETGHPR